MTFHKSWMLLSLTLLVLSLGVARDARAAVLISDNFEADTLGLFPTVGGWSDVGQAPGAIGNAPNPSATVVGTTDAFGAATQAVSLAGAFAESQGIYQAVANLPFIAVSFDFRIDQFAANSSAPSSDWAWDVGLAQTGADFAFAPSYGAYIAAQTQAARSFVQGYSGGADDFDYGGPALTAGTWYNASLELDRNAGTIKTVVTDILTNTQLLNGTRTVPGWLGFAAEPAFNAIAFFDGELSAMLQSNLTLFDNIIVSNAPIAAVPEPSTLVLWTLGSVTLVGLGWRRRKRAA